LILNFIFNPRINHASNKIVENFLRWVWNAVALAFELLSRTQNASQRNMLAHTIMVIVIPVLNSPLK